MKTGVTISKITQDGLCTGCGTCAGICPEDAIRMVKDGSKGIYIPHLDEKKCNECGLCLRACPGHEVDFKALSVEIFGKEAEDILLGNYSRCWVGHAADHDIRYQAASGGVVSALLIFALEEGMINGALVTSMSPQEPLEPHPFIARSREGIISAAKSIYCPVPSNIALKEILTKDEKFAVVGLPCHIQGLRKAELVNKKLKENIVLHLGLFCSASRTFQATEYILYRAGVSPEDIVEFRYRGEGRPGQFVAMLSNGKYVPLPFADYYGRTMRSFFIPTRCTLCSDHSNELSDIAFGDVNLPEFQNDITGISSVISRTEIGDRLLKESVSAGAVMVSELDAYRLKQSKIGSLYRKKKGVKARRNLFRLLGKPIPADNINLLKPSLTSYIHAIFLYSEIYISAKRRLWRVVIFLSTILGWGSKLLNEVGRKLPAQLG